MGEYGKAPGAINEDVKKQILGDVKSIEGRFADTLEPAFEAAKAEIGEKAHSDEDVLSYIAFPTQAENYFDYRDEMAGKIYTYEFKAID
jgi:oxaloacetate decarboxylase alpha subunit